MKRREQEKCKGGEDYDEEEKEGCTYTNAIERVSAQVEEKRQEFSRQSCLLLSYC